MMGIGNQSKFAINRSTKHKTKKCNLVTVFYLAGFIPSVIHHPLQALHLRHLARLHPLGNTNNPLGNTNLLQSACVCSVLGVFEMRDTIDGHFIVGKPRVTAGILVT